MALTLAVHGRPLHVLGDRPVIMICCCRRCAMPVLSVARLDGGPYIASLTIMWMLCA
jgi:hypothetical protein